MTEWGPDNPHPLSRMKTELIWEGKYDEYGNRRPIKLPTSPLPLQRIETIDEPHDREKARQLNLFDEDAFHRSAHRDDFRNMLILGRCTSGEGGPTMLNTAQDILNREFPELAEKIHLMLPSERLRRVGQAIAAASLPEIN